MSSHGTVDNVHTKAIAKFVSELTYDSIPDEVRERVRLLILDSLGCALYGANLPWTRILQETFTEIDKNGDTSIWGTDLKVSSPPCGAYQWHPGTGL